LGPISKATARSIVTGIGTEFILKHVEAKLRGALNSGPDRFARFREAFDEKFAKEGDARASKVMLLTLLQQPLALLYVNDANSSIVDLHGILERQTLERVPTLLSGEITKRKAISDLLSRKTLNDPVPHLVALGVWDKEDEKAVRRLSHLRNGIAHKNAELLSNLLNSGKKLPLQDALGLASKEDCVHHFLTVVALLLKLFRGRVASKAEATQNRADR
jgi:hypothetical protein